MSTNTDNMNPFFLFFVVTLFGVGFFIRSLPYGSQFSPTWNLGSLLGLSQVPVFSQAPLLVLDYRWSHDPPTYRRTITPNWYRTHTVPWCGFKPTGLHDVKKIQSKPWNIMKNGHSEDDIFHTQ